MNDGSLIVLSADRTLMAGYNLLFDGMLAASQTTTAPMALMGPLLLPRNRGNAPLGLRRVEAALVAGGFSRQDICVCTQDELPRAIGRNTRIIGLSAGEPGGGGMNSSTMSAVAGGRIWPQAAFGKLAKRVRNLRKQAHPAVKVVLGGAGAWQVAQDESLQRQLGIDHVVGGYVEDEIARLFGQWIDGQDGPRAQKTACPTAQRIPPILGPTTMGAVELSRGCGLGCSFCTIGQTTMSHLCAEAVEQDVRTNIAGGQANISLLSEDLFRYGGPLKQANPQGNRIGPKGRGDTATADATSETLMPRWGQMRLPWANPPALIALLKRLRQIPGLRLLQVDHANLFSVAQFSDDELRQVRALLGPGGQKYVWLNIGVETPSGEFLQQLGGAAKMGDCPPAQWGDFCHTQLSRLCQAGFLPFVSLLLCCPGQTPQHTAAMQEWVQRFDGMPITFFPMLLAPIGGGETSPGRNDLTALDWQFIRECYRFNFRWLPRMIWDNQQFGGERLWKRLLLQAMGQGQMALWQTLFAWRKWRAASC